MPPVGGSRAQSQVIGAVLIFAFVIAALGAAQVVLVPQSNEEVEFDHNQRAQQDMQDLRGAIQRSAVVGASQSESVDLSADYPTRLLLLNPGEGAGTIRTADGTSLTIDNANATDEEIQDFWDGGTVSAPSQRLVYSPNYNYYDNAPETVYENSVLYNRFSDRTDIAESDQDLVDGRQIYLTALDGEKSTSKSGAASVDVKSVSPATEKISVRNESGSPLEVTIPTQLSEEVWVQDLLDEEIDDPGDGQPGPESVDGCDDFSGDDENDNDRFIVNCRYDDTVTPNELTLVFQNKTASGDLVTYSLKMAKVGVGTGVTTPKPEYITDLEGNGADVPLNGRQTVVFQVRNKYNNPATNATVDVQLESSAGDDELLHQGDSVGDAGEDDIPVGPDGEVELTYVAPDSTDTSPLNVDVDAKFGDGSFGGNNAANATVSMEVINASRIDRTEPLLNSPDGIIVEGAVFRSGECTDSGSTNGCEVEIVFNNSAGSERTIEKLRYTFFSADTQGSAGSDPSASLEIQNLSNDEVDLVIKEDFVDISDIDFQSNENKSMVIHMFTDEEQENPDKVDNGDFIILSAVIDGERETYIFAPGEGSSPGESGS